MISLCNSKPSANAACVSTRDSGAEPKPQPAEGRTPSWPLQLVALVAFVLTCFAAAGVGGMLTGSSVNGWYQTLNKPAWTPPDWVFGPVWTTLFLFMAIAAWLVWRRGGWQAQRQPLTWFGLQLGLNVVWSGLFFALRNPGLGFAEVIVLWLAIAATTAQFWRRSRAAGLLFVTYLVWVAFAAILNFQIWRLNS